MSHSQRFVWLDFIRGTCAILVCAGHLRNVVITDYASLTHTSALQKAFFFATGLGHQAVMVFFVLSGFFVGGAVLKYRISFDPLRYAVARLTRLWIVLIPALLVTAAVDGALAARLPGVLSGSYRTLWNSGPGLDAPYSTSVQTFIANLLFLQTVLAPVFGTNGPLWSLSNEFWYYVLFPVVLLAVQGVRCSGSLSIGARLALGLAALIIVALLPVEIGLGFIVWCMGLIAFASFGRLSKVRALAALCVGACLFAAALGYSKSDMMRRALGMSPDIAIGAAFCLLVIGIVNIRFSTRAFPWFENLSRWISDFSYSLYAIHFPFVVLIGGLFYAPGKRAPDAAGLTQFALWLVLLLVGGFAFYLAFERRTDSARRRIERLLSLQPRPR